jgi:hypothetical protein
MKQSLKHCKKKKKKILCAVERKRKKESIESIAVSTKQLPRLRHNRTI